MWFVDEGLKGEMLDSLCCSNTQLAKVPLETIVDESAKFARVIENKWESIETNPTGGSLTLPHQ